MVALIDVNVIMNYVTLREDPHKEASVMIMKKAADGAIDGYIAFHSVSILNFILRKMDDDKRREVLRDICKILTITGASHEAVVDAIDKQDFKDFEDCLQDKCAKTVDADYIVTCNIKDYEKSEITAILPDDLLNKLNNILDSHP